MKSSLFALLCLACAFAAGCDDDDDAPVAQPDASTDSKVDAGAILDAAVLPDAEVLEDAAVLPDAEVLEDAAVLPDAEVLEDAAVLEDAGVVNEGVTGVVRFEDKIFDGLGALLRIENTPAVKVKVELVANANNAVLATSFTDENGRYSFNETLTPTASYRVRALAVIGSKNSIFNVKDVDETAVYAVSGNPFLGDLSDFEGDLLASKDDVGGAFNIVSVLRRCNEMISRHSSTLPESLTFLWSRGTEWDCGSCYTGWEIELGGAEDDPDEYDDHIIAHEYGHHVINEISADDSPGGSHRNNAVSPTLAYGEGIAYFLASLFLNDVKMVDTFYGAARVVDIERGTIYDSGRVTNREDLIGTSNGTVSGRQHEELVSSTIWDTYDAASGDEPFDNIEIGEDGVWELLLNYMTDYAAYNDKGAYGRDLADWLNGVLCLGDDSVHPEDLQTLINDVDYPWSIANDSSCGKGKTRNVRFVERNGEVVLEASESATKSVANMNFKLSWPDGQAKSAPASCSSLPCVVGKVGEVDLVIARGETTSEIASYSSAAHKKLMQGNFVLLDSSVGKVREYRSK